MRSWAAHSSQVPGQFTGCPICQSAVGKHVHPTRHHLSVLKLLPQRGLLHPPRAHGLPLLVCNHLHVAGHPLPFVRVMLPSVQTSQDVSEWALPAATPNLECAVARECHQVRHASKAETEHLKSWSPSAQPGRKPDRGQLPKYRSTRDGRFSCKGMAAPLYWKLANARLTVHYRSDSPKAEILHLLRTTRLPVLRKQWTGFTVFAYDEPGCGICRLQTTEGIHQHRVQVSVGTLIEIYSLRITF